LRGEEHREINISLTVMYKIHTDPGSVQENSALRGLLSVAKIVSRNGEKEEVKNETIKAGNASGVLSGINASGKLEKGDKKANAGAKDNVPSLPMDKDRMLNPESSLSPLLLEPVRFFQGHLRQIPPPQMMRSGTGYACYYNHPMDPNIHHSNMGRFSYGKRPEYPPVTLCGVKRKFEGPPPVSAMTTRISTGETLSLLGKNVHASTSTQSLITLSSGPAETMKKKPRTKEESKALHREVERRRTRRLNELIRHLKEEVECSGFTSKKDKASVLSSAVICIREIRRRHNLAVTEIVRLQKELQKYVVSDQS